MALNKAMPVLAVNIAYVDLSRLVTWPFAVEDDAVTYKWTWLILKWRKYVRRCDLRTFRESTPIFLLKGNVLFPLEGCLTLWWFDPSTSFAEKTALSRSNRGAKVQMHLSGDYLFLSHERNPLFRICNLTSNKALDRRIHIFWQRGNLERPFRP